MSEKKQVIYDLRYTYNGPFSVEDFYAEVQRWISDKGFEKEPKKISEQITKDGKKIQWIIEAHSHLDELHHGVIVLRATMDNVKDIIIKKHGKKAKIQNGNVYVHIDGFLDAHEHGTYHQRRPTSYFIRTIIDRFIWPFWSFKYDGIVAGQSHELFKLVRGFFDVQRYAFG